MEPLSQGSEAGPGSEAVELGAQGGGGCRGRRGGVVGKSGNLSEALLPSVLSAVRAGPEEPAGSLCGEQR